MTARKGNVESVHGLSPMQEGILFHTIHAPGSGLYVEQYTCEMDAELDPVLWERAWHHVVHRHGALRALFTWERRERPLQTVLALTPKPETARRLALVWGLEPRLSREPGSLEEVTDDAVEKAVEFGLAEPGQRLLILAGTPFGAPGAANLLRLAHVPMKGRGHKG